jgi:hypothetical protein
MISNADKYKPNYILIICIYNLNVMKFTDSVSPSPLNPQAAKYLE